MRLVPCSFKKIFIYYFFIWLHWVIVPAHRIFTVICGIFSCCRWGLVPWAGIELGPCVLGPRSLSHSPSFMVFITLLWYLHSFNQAIFIELTVCARNLLNPSFRAQLRRYKIPFSKEPLYTLCWKASHCILKINSVLKNSSYYKSHSLLSQFSVLLTSLFFFTNDFMMEEGNLSIICYVDRSQFKSEEKKIKVKEIMNFEGFHTSGTLKTLVLNTA